METIKKMRQQMDLSSNRYSSQWRADNAILEIRKHPKDVIDVDDSTIKSMKDRLSSPSKVDLSKLAKQIDDLESKIKSSQGKASPSDLRKMKEDLEKLKRQYQSAYK